MANRISFRTTPAERRVIEKIAHRADIMQRRYRESRELRSITDIEMDLCATIANGNPLRLSDLLEADDFNFAHDVFGIERHLNRETGKLENFFSPRFSKRQSEPAQ